MPSTVPKRRPPRRRKKAKKLTDLPPDILCRISSFLTCDLFSNGAENLYSALALSRTCTRLYRAVVDSNNYRIVLSKRTLDEQLPHLSTLFSLFHLNIAHLNIDYDVDYIPFIRHTPLYNQYKLGETMLFGLLIAQTLETAVIPDKAEYLLAIRNAKSLQNLHIRLHREPSRDIGNTIASLNLKNVSISNEDYFRHCPGGYPCLINVFRFGGGVAMYQSRCQSVRSVGFTCRCADQEHYSLATLLDAFPNLVEVRISAKMTAAVAQSFMSLNTVQLAYIDDPGDICRCLAERITCLRTDAMLTARDVLRLIACPRLVALGCRLEIGTEMALVRVARMFAFLRSLQLSWCPDPRLQPNREIPYDKLYRIRNWVTYLIARITRPSHFELGYVQITARELVEVFRVLGLGALNINLNRVLIHDVTTFRAMFLLIEAASVHCRNLKQLHLNLVYHPYDLGMEGEEGKSRGLKLYQALERIRRLVPCLRWKYLKQNIDDLVNYSYGVVELLQ